MRATSLLCSLIIFSGLQAGDPPPAYADNIPPKANAFLRAYPNFFSGYKENTLLCRDGSGLTFDDGRKKTFEQLLSDADPQFAARAAWFGATINRGQTCLAVRRAFVHRSLYAAFLEALRPLLESAPPMRLALAAQCAQAGRLVRGYDPGQVAEAGGADCGACHLT